VNRPRIFSIWLALPLLLSISAARLAAGPGTEMAGAATNFLNALTAEQQAKATYAFKDEERFDWHFIPKERKGLPFKEMTSAQQALAHALLSTGMSQRGYVKAVTIMSLEQILKDLEQGKGPERNPERYFFTIFGTPGGPEPWAWRVEGHHLSLNFVVRGDEVLAATPAFFGTNPAEVRDGPRKGLQVLGEEEALGFQFLRSLTAEQQTTAIVTNVAPNEMITGNSRKAQLINPPGLAAGGMTDAQKHLLRELISSFANRHRPEVAEADMAKIQTAGFDQVHFAWAGATEPGTGHYYRVQGPTFLLEFDNTQNNANHVHSVWRDLANDFGDDILRRHYEEVPHGK